MVRRGFALADMMCGLVMFSLLVVMTAQVAAVWDRQERHVATWRTLWRQAESVLEELRAGQRPLRPGRWDVEMSSVGLSSVAGTLVIEPGGPDVLRCRVELVGQPGRGGPELAVRLTAELLAPTSGAAGQRAGEVQP